MAKEKYPLGKNTIPKVKTTKKKWWKKVDRTTPEHLWIGDPQTGPGRPIQQLWWAGYHAGTLMPDVIVFGNDHFDFSTLCFFDRNKHGYMAMDVVADICAGTHGLDVFLDGLEAGQAKCKCPEWDPLILFLEGNHDYRSRRLFQEDRRLARLFPQPKTIVRRLFDERGMKVRWVNWKYSICVDDINYAHAAINPATSKPMGGKASSKLTRLKDTYVIGHHVGKDLAEDMTPSGRKIRFVQAGSFYLHDEEYSPCTNYWRGLIYMHDVKDGYFNLMEIDMEYLWKKYQDKTGWIYADPTYREEDYVQDKEA